MLPRYLGTWYLCNFESIRDTYLLWVRTNVFTAAKALE